MTVSRRATAGLICMCAIFTLAITAVGIVGMLGVRASDASSRQIADDELYTEAITAKVGRLLDRVALTASSLLIAGQDQRVTLASRLYDQDIPAVEAGMADLRAIHKGDDAAEQQVLADFYNKWHRLRGLLNALPAHRAGAPTTAASSGADATSVTAAFQPLAAEIERLSLREQRDAQERDSHASAASETTARTLLLTIVGCTLAVGAIGVVIARRIGRSLQPAQEQAVFADVLQLAQNEEEAHLLLQGHLDRAIVGATTAVLNRNNSADRLEAKTPLSPESPLNATLQHAAPRACLAVRSGRVHRSHGHDALLACAVCAACPGNTVCSPLTVGGEVIGSVLVNRESQFTDADELRMRDSVLQAAPVLANLRNLAIAEKRAATDSLTGLPNKRASGDVMKQLLAQAARVLTPLSVLLLDLDHFKDINDRLGHPVGDTVLANVGAALRSAMRESDFAGRTGGEEFLVLLPNTGIVGAVEAAERIRAAIASVAVPGEHRTMSASIGVATYPDHATTGERLERLADAALYLAKRSGRDRTELATIAGEGVGLAPSSDAATTAVPV